MNDLLRKDILKYPDIFWFSQPVEELELQQARLRWNPPDTLLAFWREFGGGLMFESEDILPPFSIGLSLDLVTSQERAKGFPDGLIVFHTGVVVSGFSANGFEAFDLGSYLPLGQFASLDDWYVGAVRGLFDERYGLQN